MKKFLVTLTALICAVVCSLLVVGCGASPNKVNVKYLKNSAEVKSALRMGSYEIGMVAEPDVSELLADQDNTWYTLDVQELYDAQAKAYPQAVLMVKSSLLKAYPEIATFFENNLNSSVQWVKEKPQMAVNAIKNIYPNTTIDDYTSSQAIDNCKIYFQGATDAKASVNTYISDIMAIYPEGINQVEDSFFYSTQTKSGEWTKNGISVYSPDGAPALALAKFINDSEDFGTGKTMNYNIVSSTEIVAKMATGVADIIVMPLNGATKKYNADGNANDPYQLVSVVTHGNFYFMSKTPITSLDQLIGKNIAVPSQNAVPGLTFQVIMSKNNLEIQILQ